MSFCAWKYDLSERGSEGNTIKQITLLIIPPDCGMWEFIYIYIHASKNSYIFVWEINGIFFSFNVQTKRF